MILIVVCCGYALIAAVVVVLQLQATLNEVEEQISAARRAFNATVMEYNNSVMQFPSSIVANMYNFKYSESFSIPEGERQPVDVKKMFNE